LEHGSHPCKPDFLSIMGDDASCEARVERGNGLVIRRSGISVSLNPLVTSYEPASTSGMTADASLDPALPPDIGRFPSTTRALKSPDRVAFTGVHALARRSLLARPVRPAVGSRAGAIGSHIHRAAPDHRADER
jgi:hypothetical protein